MYLPENIDAHLQGNYDFQMEGMEVWLKFMEDMPCLQERLAAFLKHLCRQ